MSKNIFPAPAFVLHARPYNDTSLLLDLFTLDYGRVTAISRGVRKKNSKLFGLLLPFVPLVALLSGKSEIFNVVKVEADGLAYNLQGHSLLSGFYLNELLVRLLHKHDVHVDLYHFYAHTLQQLQQVAVADNLQRQRFLRLFELRLLQELGYGLQLDTDVFGVAIDVNVVYKFKFGSGFSRVEQKQCDDSVFTGSSLLALRNDKLITNDDFKLAKRLLQLCLTCLLGKKPIKTRELFKYV